MVVDDSSSSSPSFRELDDVFLQTQARIWLAEVLHTRFDEQLSTCNLLSDGELLLEISKTMWNMLLVKYMELRNLKACMFIRVDRRKSIGRYRPYSNVDSFLKVCKVLGLSGVDLFSPSDVVEKRDTRKVCICIRSLSKKARSKQLNVPDFDIVTNTVTMATEAVRCIRRSLELSTSRVTHGQSKHAKLKFRQKSSFASHEQEDEWYLEESNEAKYSFSDTSYTDFLYLESGESPKTINKYALTENQETGGSTSPISSSRSLVICDEFTPTNHGAIFWHDNGESSKKEEVDYMCLSDTISFKILSNVHFHVSEDCVCPSCSITWRKVSDDIEASSTSSGSSVVGHVLDFDAKSEEHDHRYLEQRGANMDEKEDNGIDCLVEADGKRIVKSEKKATYFAPLVKTVAKGTALIGILFLLHLRNRSDRNTNNKSSGLPLGLLSRKGNKGSKIYPVDRFKFGD